MAPRSDRRVAFYTSNPGKLEEVRAALRTAGWQTTWGRGRLTEPQADTLEQVARAKLAQVPRHRGPVLVEDAGLFVPSLGGFPGVYSSYAFHTIGAAGLLRLVGPFDRQAVFRAVLGFRDSRGPRLFTGEVRGTLARRPRGSAGFGFDPVFVPEGERATFAQMTVEEKTALSHRGRALRTLVRHLSR